IQGVSESSTSSQQDQDNQDCIVMPIRKDASYFDDVISTDKSIITRKQSKSSKHGHENQKSTKKPSLSPKP
ncbi:hypothetical protein Tco_0326369, partial [Tanacetum coccineum]